MALLLFALPLSACAQTDVGEQWRAVDVSASPAALGAEEVGQLRFIGGVSLRSEAAAFGGLSDIAIQPDGAFLAITDAGYFVRGRFTLNESGAPTDVSNVEIGAMRDETGEIFPNKESADSEGMTLLPDGRVAVSFEQTQSIRFYDLSDGPFAAAQAGPALAGIEQLSPNSGLEALAIGADGRLLVGAEGPGTLWSVAPEATEPTPPQATLALPLGYGLVELDALPDGDFIALERFYAPVIGNRIRILRLSAASLGSANGAATATELARLASPMEIDNFEGASVVKHGARTMLYIVSDDNFSNSQRTLIYAFELVVPEAAAEPAGEEETP